MERWQRESGEAITRRMLVAAVACVVVCGLQVDDSPEALETRASLVRLSGRSVRFIRLGGEPALIRYNSGLPVVVYVPEGAEFRYRIRTTGYTQPMTEG